MSPGRRALITLAVMLPITAFAAFISLIVFPFQARWMSPWLCDAPDTDLFVVSDRAGRGTNFTTYCAGPRGERHEVASMRPELILWGAYYLVMGPAAALITYFRTSRP